MIATATGPSTSDADLYCGCVLTAGDEVKVEIDDGAIFVACPRCGRQVSLETVSVHASARTVTLAVEGDADGEHTWLEARI